MIIYKTTNLINNKIYIGKDSNNNDNYLGSGVILKKSIIKYGKHNFKKEILQECKTQKELNNAEIYWINKLDSRNNDIGYNIALGGDGQKHGTKLSEETKKKIGISQTLIGYINRLGVENGTKKYNEKINKQSDAQKKRFKSQTEKDKVLNFGNKNGMYGKEHTKETIEKISKKMKLKIGHLNTTYDTYWINKDNTIIRINKKILQTYINNGWSKGTGLVIVKDEHGNTFNVSINDERYLSGELISIWKNKKHTDETKKKMSEKGKLRTGSLSTSFGTYWITKNKINKKIKKDELQSFINDGWIKGRYNNKRHIIFYVYDLNNNFISKENDINLFALRNNFKASNIVRVLNNKRKHTNKLKFSYIKL